MKVATDAFIVIKRLYCKNLRTFSRCSACPLYHPSVVTSCAEFEPASFMQAGLCQNLKTTVSFMFTLKNLKVLGGKPYFKMLLPSVSEIYA